jgi:hypothetical protein
MILTQNRELRQDGVWNFTLPAWVVELPDGSHFNVCPNAGACAKFCYARNGTYLFPKVRGKHLRNLELVQRPDWAEDVAAELSHKRFSPKGVARVIPGLGDVEHLSPWVRSWIEIGGQAVRIHDSGDFFSREYLDGWVQLAWYFPEILFYAYTKEVSMMEDVKDDLPPNFLYCYSMGGRQDHLIDRDTMRHADVFPDLHSIAEAGYMSQHQSDLLCVLLPTTRVGIPQNNIPHFRKGLAGRTFSEAQQERRTRTRTAAPSGNPGAA